MDSLSPGTGELTLQLLVSYICSKLAACVIVQCVMHLREFCEVLHLCCSLYSSTGFIHTVSENACDSCISQLRLQLACVYVRQSEGETDLLKSVIVSLELSIPSARLPDMSMQHLYQY